jgi:hypothetical protein
VGETDIPVVNEIEHRKEKKKVECGVCGPLTKSARKPPAARHHADFRFARMNPKREADVDSYHDRLVSQPS